MCPRTHVAAVSHVLVYSNMGMIEFEDRDVGSRRALLHYIETGEPEEAHGADLVWAILGILIFAAFVILPFLAH